MNKVVIVTIKTTLSLQDVYFIYSLYEGYNFKDSFYCWIILSSIKKGNICEQKCVMNAH